MIIAARNLKAAEEVKSSIIQATPKAEVECIELDLSSLASVKKFADQFLATGYPLHLLMYVSSLSRAFGCPRSFVQSDGRACDALSFSQKQCRCDDVPLHSIS